MSSPEDLLGRVRRRVLATPGGYDGAALAVALRDELPGPLVACLSVPEFPGYFPARDRDAPARA